ncbi:MAG: hypothetical protein H0T79_07090 [Deltaproteobacteria bacterium]|nr:hypothetical protein [Deltaproteobacteria bacterium]
MYTLPRNIRMTIRKVEKPLRALVLTCVPKWSGDKVSVLLSDRVEKSSTYEQFCRYDLARGTHEWVPHFDGRREYIAIAPGEAILKLSHHYGLHNGEVTLYVHAFATQYEVEDELGIARDAMLEGNHQAAHRIAKRALPHGHGLFEALIRHEQRLLPRLRLAD